MKGSGMQTLPCDFFIERRVGLRSSASRASSAASLVGCSFSDELRRGQKIRRQNVRSGAWAACPQRAPAWNGTLKSSKDILRNPCELRAVL